MNPTEKPAPDTPIETIGNLWTAQECADYLRVKKNTWHSYVYRPGKNNAAPKPAFKVGNTPLWHREEVEVYAKNRYRALNRQFDDE
ncbi:hypothetical protein [Rhodococcus sp. NPDC049939]|uniref:hypothetical protein n=1 Tax=Rhodococcus sp. NPDC049939 TaxID=3155511 RepID=UPI0033F214E9